MKRFLLAAFCLIAAPLFLSAQQPDIEAHLKAHPELLAGTDYLCPTGPVALTKAPKGYKAFYISHYGRHGARYAWQSDIYELMNNTFTAAAEAGNLTEFGLDYKRRFKEVTSKTLYEYITDQKLKYFAEQLEDTDEQVINIALSMGEIDTKSISRRFKQLYGCTPVEWRAKQRKNKIL